jgi:hypothetical protein
MVSNERSVVYCTLGVFLMNFILHAYVVLKAFTAIPQNLLVVAACIPFFPVWIVVMYGLLKRRKWTFQLGLAISILGLMLSLLGIFWLVLVEAYATLVVDIVQIVLCAYGLKKLKF